MKKIKKMLSLLLVLSMVLVGYLGNGNEVLAEVDKESKELIFNIHLIELNPVDFLSHDEYKEGYDGSQIEDLTKFFGASAKLANMDGYEFKGTISNSVNKEVVEAVYKDGILTFKELPKYNREDPYIVKVELVKGGTDKIKKAIPMEFEMPNLDTLEKMSMHLYPKITEESSTISKRLKVNLDENNNFITDYKEKVRYFEKGEKIEWFARLDLINYKDIELAISKGEQVGEETLDGILIEDIRNSENIKLSKETTIRNPKAYLNLKIDGMNFSEAKTFDIKNPIRVGDKILIEEKEITDFMIELVKKLPNIDNYDLDSIKTVENLYSELSTYCMNETPVGVKPWYKYDMNMSITFELDGYVLESMSPGNYLNDLAVRKLGDSFKASEFDGVDEFNVADYDLIKVSTTELEENGQKKRLPGAEFKLVNKDGWVLTEGEKEEKGFIWMKEDEVDDKGQKVKVFISDEQGKIKVPGLGEEEYRLVEIKAPEGYHMDPKNPGNYTTSLVIKKLDQTIEVPNTKLTIPPTGGIGTIVFVLLGLGLLSFAAITISKDKKKTQEL